MVVERVALTAMLKDSHWVDVRAGSWDVMMAVWLDHLLAVHWAVKSGIE